MDNKMLARNAVLNTVKTVLGIGFPLITFPYVSRVLGVESLGIYNFASSIVAYFLLFAGLGIPTYAVREGARYRDNPEKLQSFVSEIFTLNTISTAVSYGVLILCVGLIPKLQDHRLAITILSVEIISTTIGSTWICNVFEDFKSITIRTTVFQVISLCLLILIVKSPSDIYRYLFIVALSNSGSNFVNYIYVRTRYGIILKPEVNTHWKKHVRPIMVIFSTSVAVTIYVSSDMTMLGFLTSDYYVGIYSTAVKIYTIIKNILSSFLIVFIPQFSIMLSSNKTENQAKTLFSRIFCILTLMLLPVSTGLFMTSRDVIQLISGTEYIDAVPSLKVLSIAIMFSLYAFIYVQCALIPAKEESVVFRTTCISAVVNVVLNLVLIPRYGIVGAALTTTISELLTFLLAYNKGRKIICLEGIGHDLLSIIAGCVAIVLVCMVSNSIDVLALRLIVQLVASAALYVFVLLLFKNKAILDLLLFLRPNNQSRY